MAISSKSCGPAVSDGPESAAAQPGALRDQVFRTRAIAPNADDRARRDDVGADLDHLVVRFFLRVELHRALAESHDLAAVPAAIRGPFRDDLGLQLVAPLEVAR